MFASLCWAWYVTATHHGHLLLPQQATWQVDPVLEQTLVHCCYFFRPSLGSPNTNSYTLHWCTLCVLMSHLSFTFHVMPVIRTWWHHLIDAEEVLQGAYSHKGLMTHFQGKKDGVLGEAETQVNSRNVKSMPHRIKKVFFRNMDCTVAREGIFYWNGFTCSDT